MRLNQIGYWIECRKQNLNRYLSLLHRLASAGGLRRKALASIAVLGMLTASGIAEPVWAQAKQEGKKEEKGKVLAEGRFDSRLDEKVVRYTFNAGETGFDPAQISDLYSRTVVAAILETLYTWDYLARPVKIVPALAESMPEVSPDFKTFTVRLKKGVMFAKDPAFGGKPRELTAEDVVYSLKRHYDPKYKSYAITTLQTTKLLGLNELREAAIKSKTPFPYDQPVEGVKALDRYTVQFKTQEPAPRFMESYTDPSLFGIVAREVVEAAGDRIMERPVGTGPYKLAAWRRQSKIVLERNPDYREVIFDSVAAPNDALGAEIEQRLKGKRIPVNDRVEISIINEELPRWLAFENGEHDLLQQVPGSFVQRVLPNNQLAPYLSKKGVRLYRTPLSDITVTVFNMEDPVVGGYTPEKVALRRAIGLATNIEEEIRLARRGQAIPLHMLQPPGTTGFDPKYRSTMGEYSVKRASALLDLYGYVDKDGDGWRDLPDGKPLVLKKLSQTDTGSRQFDELTRKAMSAVKLKIEFEPAKWPDNLKKARSGNFQIWALGFSAIAPDPDNYFNLSFGPAKGEGNLSRFARPEYDALYLKQKSLPDGPEREKVLLEAHKMVTAYMPYKGHTHRIAADVSQPWTYNYYRHPFMREIFKYIEVDTAARVKALGD